MIDEKPYPCELKEDGDELEKAHYDIIEAEIPEYIRFWEEYIGVRGRHPREPYRLVPAGDGNVPDSLTDWHWATCETHYSFLHHWLEASWHLRALRKRSKAPSPAKFECFREELRTLECGMMRVGNARNMIMRLWCLLGELVSGGRDFYSRNMIKFKDAMGRLFPQGIPKNLSDASNSLKEVIHTRDYVVHTSISAIEIFADGLPKVPYIHNGQPFRGWRKNYKGRFPMDAMLEMHLDTLTRGFNISEYELFKKTREMFDHKSVELDWKTRNGPKVP